MTLFNLVSQKKDINQILRDLIVMGYVELKDAFEDIDGSDFTLSMMEENADEIIDMVEIKHCKKNDYLRDTKGKLEYILNRINYKPEIDKSMIVGDYSFDDVKERIDKIYEHFKELADEIDEVKTKLEKLDQFSSASYLKGIDINFRQISNLENFVVKWGYLTKENKQKVARNYENISAIVIHIGEEDNKEAFMVISPKELEVETNRILRSVNFSEVYPDQEYFDYPDAMINKMNHDRQSLKSRLKDLTSISNDYLKNYQDEIIKSCSRIKMEEKVEIVMEKIATTKNFIYMSAWIPEDKKESISNYFEQYGDSTILTFRDIKSLNKAITIPTKLKNNIIFSPFEELVKMYGIPSYNEIDPTIFFAISYMLLFGAMFGDLGQGLIIFLAGILVGRTKNKNYGGILTRLGIASMLFGIVYDSFFGYEHVISKFIPWFNYIRPIENINAVLTTSIFIGIVLLTISLVFSIINKLNRNDVKEGIFGRNGVAGLVLFSSLILIAIEILMDIVLLPRWLLITFAIVSIALIIVREPLANLILGKRPLYHSGKGEYYVESGFDIFETFLSILSNSISFIRVGAFALNHVGLFIAFHTMAHIIGNVAGDISMFIIGNVIVIVLEGLIVFIQGLRLVYYEMFSKYYEGEGILFEPDQILGGN